MAAVGVAIHLTVQNLGGRARGDVRLGPPPPLDRADRRYLGFLGTVSWLFLRPPRRARTPVAAGVARSEGRAASR